MAQSYGTFTNQPILPATDEILGVTRELQTLGTSISGVSATSLSAANNMTVTVDTVAYAIALDANDTPEEIAADIEAKTILAGAPADFTCVYDGSRYILTSPTATSSPATAQVLVTNGAGTAATILRLGTAQGGTESYTTGATDNEYVTWTFRYRFVYTNTINGVRNADYSYAAADVVFGSENMTDPMDDAEAKLIADGIAASLKAQRDPSLSYGAAVELTSQNGPVTL